ncbi:MAG: ATP--guanido phosphotransferase [Clostridia bacterium]|nr:ATP--guanido phosphotransferase [Clostridia bacterium]
MGNKQDVILRSRVRLARNIVDYPFAPVLNTACRKEIIEKAENALRTNGYTRQNDTDNTVAVHALSEENLVSREFADDKELHALLCNADANTYIMVCEEDHLRIQSFADGADLTTAGKRAFAAERLLNEKIKFAFDRELGYLTHCPTNLGTAMRASMMMFLPALTMLGRMGDLKSQLEKIGVTIRGLYGEGSAADAYMYQISNRLSLGLSEDDLLRKIESVASRIAEDELRARKSLLAARSDALTDKILRSLGILKYAHMISGKEFLDCYAYVRLGISLGLIDSVQLSELDKLLYEAMPAHLIAKNKDAASDATLRDKLRAETIKRRI